MTFFGCAATTLAVFWAVCDRVAWPLSLAAFFACFDAATRRGAAWIPTGPFAVEALVVCRLLPPPPDCSRVFPTIVSEPIEGATVDSSPVDHRTRKSDPVTPVTTPSRGASPIFLEGTCTRSPTTAICRMVPQRGVSGQRGPTAFARRRSWRLFNLPSLRGGTLDPGWLRPVTTRTRISVAVVEATGLSKCYACQVRAEKFTPRRIDMACLAELVGVTQPAGTLEHEEAAQWPRSYFCPTGTAPARTFTRRTPSGSPATEKDVTRDGCSRVPAEGCSAT